MSTMLKNHCDKITLRAALRIVNPAQEIEIMKFECPGEMPTETIYKGYCLDLYKKIALAPNRSYEKSDLYKQLEYSEVMNMQAHGNVLVIEVEVS